MKLIKPSYFDEFRCIASACPDSCCKEWDVQIDDDKAALYRSLPGELGDRLREVLTEEDGETIMTIMDGRCPMWRTDGLCRIQAELGEGALCKTCREFPRLTHDYGDFIEYGLELSCPEAARIILNAPAPTFVLQEVPGGEEPEYDKEVMSTLLRTRETARKILSDTSRTTQEALVLLLMYAYRVQGELLGNSVSPFTDEDYLLEHAKKYARPGDCTAILDFYKSLEILTPEWAARLNRPSPAEWDPIFRTLAQYFVDRYWLQSISDGDLDCRVKFAIVSCLVIHTLGGNLIETAQTYSKEIENSIENVETILDAVYENPIFADAYLFGLLLL